MILMNKTFCASLDCLFSWVSQHEVVHTCLALIDSNWGWQWIINSSIVLISNSTRKWPRTHLNHMCPISNLWVCILLPVKHLDWIATLYSPHYISIAVDSLWDSVYIGVQMIQELSIGHLLIVHIVQYLPTNSLNCLIVTKKINQQFFILWFELAHSYRVYVGNLYLISSYFKAFGIGQHRECLPRSNIFSDLIKLLNKELVK